MGRKKRRSAGKPARQPSPPQPPPQRREPLIRLSLPELHPLRPRPDLFGLALLFTGVLVLYAASTPRTVMLEDDGLFITTATFAGVAHPPGYPLYIALGWLASLVPFGSVAWRVHALSGLMGALTCACIAWIVLRRTGNRPAAILAGAAFAVSEHFWSQAIIADVYTTNTAVVFLTLALVQEAAQRRSTRLWAASAAVYGLGLANHYPLLILASPLFLAWAVAAGKDFRGRVHYLLPMAVLPAAALYAWMVWRSNQPLPINFWDPSGPGASSSPSSTAASTGTSTRTSTPVSPTSSSMPDTSRRRRCRSSASWAVSSRCGARSRRTGAAGVSGSPAKCSPSPASSFLLIALLGFNYEPLRIYTFRPYPLVAYGILALWLGYGLHHGLHALARRGREGAGPLLPVACAVCALAVAALGVWNGRVNYRPHDRFAEEQAQAMLDAAGKDGAFVLYADPFVGPMTYLHWVEGRRPGLRLLEYHGLVFADRVVEPLSTTQQKTAGWAEFLQETEEPVYSLWFGPAFSAAGLAHLGFFVEVYREVGPGRIQIRANDAARELFRKLVTMPEPKDLPSAVHRNEMMRGYGEYLGLAQVDTRSALNDYAADVLPLAEGNYWSLMGMSKALASQGGDRPLRLAETYLQKAMQLAGDDRGKEHRATELFVEGRIAWRKGDTGRARTLYRESLRIDRDPSNPARQALEELAKSSGN